MYDDDAVKNSPISLYQPSKDACEFTDAWRKDYYRGDQILRKGYTELNGRSIINDENRGQLMFNAFVDTENEDPSEDWKWRGTRSMARNKGIAMHAQLTASFLLPLFTAQNDADEVDRDFSEVMRDLIEWMAMPNNSNYQSSFIQVVFGMMHNPVTYLGAEYCEVFQTIREKAADGKYTTKEILDEVMSGFQCPIYSSTQILITNAFERNHQKQKRTTQRRYVEKSELEGMYGDHPNWPLVQAGIRAIYNSETGLFYDVKDDDSYQYLVAEEISKERTRDTEVPFLNGIYFGDMDSIENNPIKHRDNRGAPKYNVVPFGYSRIGEHFYYFKSMMNCLGWDNNYYDAMSEIVMNRAILEVEMPIVVSGSDSVDSDMVFPNAVTSFESAETKVLPLLPQSNMAAGFNALRETEKSISEGSVSDTASGQLPEASQKAYNVAQAQAASKVLIKNVGRTLGESIMAYGDLMKDIAINHIAVPQVDQIVGDSLRLKYRQFMLPNKTSKGKRVDKKIKFDADLIGLNITDKEKSDREMELLEDSGYPDNKESIIHVNPEMFAHFRFYSRIDIEEMFPKNEEYWQATLTNLKTTLAMDPYTDQEGLTRRLMYAYFKSDGDDLVKKPQAAPPQQIGGGMGQQDQLGQMMQAKGLQGAVKSAVAA